jgi:hypothetical protein
MLLVLPRYPYTLNGPEFSGVGHVAAEGVPVEVRVFGTQCRQPGLGKPVSLVSGLGVRLFHPPEAAPTADLVVDGEYLFTVEVGGALAPAGALTGRGVLPPSFRDRGWTRTEISAQQSTPETPQRRRHPVWAWIPPYIDSRLSGEEPRRPTVVDVRHGARRGRSRAARVRTVSTACAPSRPTVRAAANHTQAGRSMIITSNRNPPDWYPIRAAAEEHGTLPHWHTLVDCRWWPRSARWSAA